MGAETAFQRQNGGLKSRNSCFQWQGSLRHPVLIWGRVMSIGSYQLFWNENQGGKVLTHNHFINKTEKSKVLMLLFPPKRRAAASSLHLSPPLWGSYPATLKWRPTASPIISHHPSSPLQCTMGWVMSLCSIQIGLARPNTSEYKD